MTVAVQSVWQPEIAVWPQEKQALQWQRTRERFVANFTTKVLSSYFGRGIVSGWNFTNSYTEGEAVPGTAAEPDRVYWYTPGERTNKTKWVKAELTWSGGLVIRAEFWYSEDNQGTYVPMYDEQLNYVLTLTYDGTDLATALWDPSTDPSIFWIEDGVSKYILESGGGYLSQEG